MSGVGSVNLYFSKNWATSTGGGTSPDYQIIAA